MTAVDVLYEDTRQSAKHSGWIGINVCRSRGVRFACIDFTSYVTYN